MGLVSIRHTRQCAYLLTTKAYLAVRSRFNWTKIRKALEDFNDV